MAQEIINIGTTPNDGTGDPLRTAFTKVNENFTELYDTADTQDLDFTGDSGTGAVELDSQTLNLVGTNGVQTTASGQTITIDTSSLDTRLTTAEADIDTNTATITTEETARIAADTTLQTNIDAEATTRGSADTTLQTNIDSEAATRLANDNTLQSNIDAEAATRLANDNTLQGNIDTEASTRSSADTALQGQIDSNDTDIATNAANIATNTTNISSNDTDISGLDTRLTTAEGNITSNDTDITGLDNRLTTAEGNISSNDTDIATNASNIATNATDIATNVTNIASNDTDISNLQSGKQDISEKNQANGYAPLDSGAKIPIANLPDSVVGQVEYQGTWNASTDTPTLPSASTVKGHYYVVSVGGTYETITYAIGDWIISNGVAWEKIDNTDAVTTVFGRLGAIVANESDYSSYYPLIADLTAAEADITALQNDKYDKTGGTISGNATITGNLIVDTNTLYVNSSTNNVGIGVVPSNARLDVKTTGNQAIYAITDGGWNGLEFTSDNGTTIGALNAYDGLVKIGTPNGVGGVTGAINIDSSGNVGIGGTPNANAKLDVYGGRAYFDATNEFTIRLSDSGTIGGFIGTPSSGTLGFYSSTGAERMRIDSSGNVGIGSSNPSGKFEVNLVGAFAYFTRTAGDNGSLNPAIAFGTDSTLTRMYSYGTGMTFWTAAVGNTAAERMRITSGGNVGIGTNSPTSTLHLESANSPSLRIKDTTQGVTLLAFSQNSDSHIGTYSNHPLVFDTNSTERMRISSAGETNVLSAGTPFTSRSSLAASTGANLFLGYYSATSTSNGSLSFIIRTNGDVLNTNNSYGAISDIKLKENIVDATPKLDDLMQIKIRNYNLIGEETKQLGVVAQELEEVFPALVSESPDFEEQEVPQLDENGQDVLDENGDVVMTTEKVDLGTTTKSVKYSVFVPMLIKAVQELKAEIETLKSQINN